MLLKGAYCVGEHFVDPHCTFARLTLAFVTVPKSHILPQMVIFVLLTPAAKTLVSLHICSGIVKGQSSHELAAKALANLHIRASSLYLNLMFWLKWRFNAILC